MAKLLLNLRNVPDDESAEVRALLDRHRVDYYETRPSPWGISAGGLWVRDADEFARAKSLLADYQQARGEQARAERRRELEQGRAETFGSLLRTRPLFVLLVLAGMALVASLVLLPFLLLSR
ncbi:MAG TPA: hypothetical protein DDZ67_05645 [Xanthomonadaceae bacterium]|nr:hypothetical protein [Xanthomonadaceae bacterium]